MEEDRRQTKTDERREKKREREKTLPAPIVELARLKMADAIVPLG